MRRKGERREKDENERGKERKGWELKGKRREKDVNEEGKEIGGWECEGKGERRIRMKGK